MGERLENRYPPSFYSRENDKYRHIHMCSHPKTHRSREERILLCQVVPARKRLTGMNVASSFFVTSTLYTVTHIIFIWHHPVSGTWHMNLDEYL